MPSEDGRRMVREDEAVRALISTTEEMLADMVKAAVADFKDRVFKANEGHPIDDWTVSWLEFIDELPDIAQGWIAEIKGDTAFNRGMILAFTFLAESIRQIEDLRPPEP